MYMAADKKGAVAQLARAPALQAGCRGFEPLRLHHSTCDVIFTPYGSGNIRVVRRGLIDNQRKRLEENSARSVRVERFERKQLMLRDR